METVRKPFQGVWNIIRFNWPFYVLAAGLLLILFLLSDTLLDGYSIWLELLLLVTGLSVLGSLFISAYVYDLSVLYRLDFLGQANSDSTWLNIHAGFDESSVLIEDKFKPKAFCVFDFYDPLKHSEVSIRRARKAYPPYPGTERIITNRLPCDDKTVGTIILFLTAHEIRDDQERVVFFKEVKRVLMDDGKVFVVEHLRNRPNFLAYTLGFFHFHSRATWLRTFEGAGLQLNRELKLNPFIRLFELN